MIKNRITAVTMPVLVTLAYLFWRLPVTNCTSDSRTVSLVCGALMAAFPAVLLSLAVRKADRPKGILSARIYSFEVLFPFLWIAVCSIIGFMPFYTVFAFLTLPVALGCSETMIKAISCDSDIIGDLSARTSTLQLLFSIILSLTFIADRLF